MSDQPYRRPQADPEEIIKAARRRARAASSRRRSLVGEAADAPVFDGNLAVQPAPVERPVEAPPVESPASPQRETVVLPRTRPTERTAASPAPEPVEVPRPAFVGGIAALVIAGIVGLLLLNTVINEDAYHLQELRSNQAELNQAEQALADELTNLNSPNSLAAEAERLGMERPDTVTYLYLPGGETVEMPRSND